jgi:hypothetical protein
MEEYLKDGSDYYLDEINDLKRTLFQLETAKQKDKNRIKTIKNLIEIAREKRERYDEKLYR